MAKDVDIYTDITEFQRKWWLLDRIVTQEATTLLKRFMWGFAYDMEQKRMSGYWKNPGRIGVGTRTGNLKREFASSLVMKGKVLARLVAQAKMGQGVSSKYAAIQEKGGTIKKKNKKLKVPLPDALTSTGLPKKAALSKDLVVLVRKTNGETKVFLGVKMPKGTPDVFYWILKDKVVLKKRLGFISHFDKYKAKHVQPLIKRALAAITAKFEKA